jgi:hypothetical protein
MAAVTRQAVSAVESGHSDPSLRVALALSRALGLTVEELFGPGDPADPVLAQPVAPVGGEGSRVTLATVGDTFVALPLRADTLARAGFGPAGVHRGDGEAEPPDGAELVGFTCWREGLVFRPATQITGLDGAIRRGLRLVNREPGAQARTLLDRELARLGLDPAGPVELPGADLALAAGPAGQPARLRRGALRRAIQLISSRRPGSGRPGRWCGSAG